MNSINASNIYKNKIYIQNAFKKYYENNTVTNIIDISKREFGIGDYGKKISQRHLYFNDESQLNTYLKTKTPFFISYSVGYFKFPQKNNMQDKQLYESDLVYEFDADDFDLPCFDKHNVWVCKNCGSSDFGNLKNCPKCSSPTQIIEWTCDKCLSYAKKETIRLANVLENDFNLDLNKFVFSFSGSKGYHIRIFDETIRKLSKTSRLQLMNYVLGKNIDIKELGFINTNKVWQIPNINEVKGFSKKILDYLYFIINNEDINIFKKLGISPKSYNIILKNKHIILKKMYDNILWPGLSFSFWEKHIQKAITKNSFNIDPASSQDIYKIMRVPNTIHGGTGLLSNHIKTIDELKTFQPFVDTVVLDTKNYKKIKTLYKIPKFKLIDNSYGPYEKDEVLDLPEAVSIFLILKGVAI